jgi:hypothetical protein
MPRHNPLRLLWIAALVVSLTPAVALCQDGSSSTASSSAGQQSQAEQEVLPRGKKLMLKDGSFHLVREYKVEGNRVRYYSLERSQWEEIPVSLVDWDATKKVEGEQAKQDDALVAKLKNQEAERKAEVLDIDASLEAAPGVFVPQGVGIFAFDGKSVLALAQAETDSKLSKGKMLEQVMVPVPIVPSRHKVTIQGAHAKVRLKSVQPEFYMRTADGREPEIELVHTKVQGDKRFLENIDQLFTLTAEKADVITIQRWEVAHGVYRFTLGENLKPGEYAIAEMLRGEGMALYVWDFGVDATAETAAATAGSKDKN